MRVTARSAAYRDYDAEVKGLLRVLGEVVRGETVDEIGQRLVNQQFAVGDQERRHEHRRRVDAEAFGDVSQTTVPWYRTYSGLVGGSPCLGGGPWFTA